MPEPHHSVFTVPVLFLTPNQQCQSTEGNMLIKLLLVFVEPDFFFQHSNSTLHVHGPLKQVYMPVALPTVSKD